MTLNTKLTVYHNVPGFRHLSFQSDLGKRWEEEQKPTFLRNLENLLISNNGGDGYFVGDSVSKLRYVNTEKIKLA